MTPTPLRVFLDADVIIAGSASPRGASHALLLIGALGLVQAWTSPGVVTEVRRNLLRSSPGDYPFSK